MIRKIYNTTLIIAIISLHVFLFSPGIHAQDPGFFLDDWQGKIAEIPDYEMVDKPGNDASVNIYVDINQEVNKVPKYIYGNNAVCWGGNMNEHETVMTDINNLNPHVLRWPGGNLSNEYFWNLSEDQRPVDIPDELDPWYGINDDGWQMSTDDYYDLLANTNSTGIICVNYSYARYGTGPDPVAKAAHMAAEWVRYDNGRSKFWEIGNENFGNWQTGYQIDVTKNQDGQPEYISGQLYGQHCKIFIDSMRAAAAEIGVDIKIGVQAYDEEESWDPIQTVWNEGVMPEVGDIADFLIVHQYFTPWNENSTVSTILNSHHVPADIMSVMVDDMAEAGKPMIPVAFTEWNIFAIDSMQQVSYINGIHSALVLGEFIQNDYGLATRWDLTNGWNDKGNDHGMFSRGGEPGVDYYNPRPVFFYMYYFQKYFGDMMINTSVTGNNDVVAYASSFSSGETGIVIINKSTSDEIVNIEIDNIEPGMKYYYHILTGGDDNGSFSRKVFLNGYGTDEEGGGPDEYETIKAFASGVEGGIKVNLPSLSVVYLMVDREPPPSYVYSKIDTNARVITVELSEAVILSGDSSGFEVISNGIDILTITGIQVDTGNTSLVYILLDQEVLPDDELTLSYSGDNVMSEDSIALTSFSNVLVDNLLPGATPKLKDVFTTYDGSLIHLVFNMGMQVSGSPVDSFMLISTGDPNQPIELSGVHVDDDSNKIVITPAGSLFAEYNLVLSYSGTNVISMDGALLEPFDSIPVTNNSPGIPPELVSAEVMDFGFSIDVLFSKPMNNLSGSDSLFTVKVNDEIIKTEITHPAGNSITILLEDYVQYGDIVTISYEGITITSLDRGKLQPVENFTVNNTLPEPAVFDIPGTIDAESFTINIGMILEICSDEGGGYNLGYIDPGDWAEYAINVSKTGYYKGNLRIAGASNTGRLVIQTPDGEILNQDTVAIPYTGGWQYWSSLPVEIILYEGLQRLRITALSPHFNINWLSLEFDRTLLANVVSAMTNETGDAIEIVFDREMAVPGEGEHTGFGVQADGRSVTATQLVLKNDQKTTLILELSETLSVDDENITVSYESGTLVAADNRAVPFFTDIHVTNNVNTNVEPLQTSNFIFYPNPAYDYITVESDEFNISGVEITDLTGKRILYNDWESPRNTIRLDLKISPGVYLLKIRSGDDIYTSKLIVY